MHHSTFRKLTAMVFGLLTAIALPASADELIPTGLSAYPDAVLADNPEAYFRLNEAPASPTVNDIAGGRTGIVAGGTTFGSAGPLGFGPTSAASFDGTGKIDVPAPATNDATLNTNSFSIELFARVTGGASYRSPITSRSSSGGARGYLMYANPGNVWEYWTGNGGWAVATGPAVTPNAWTHLVGTYDDATDTMRYYIDGVQVATAPSVALYNTDRPFRIGAGDTDSPGGFFFVGDIAEVAYYDYALSAGQVANHFDASSEQLFIAVPEPSTLAILSLGAAGIVWQSRRRRLSAATANG